VRPDSGLRSVPWFRTHLHLAIGGGHEDAAPIGSGGVFTTAPTSMSFTDPEA
jgi:hypothetical protein